MWFEIKWHLKYYSCYYILVLAVLLVGCGLWNVPNDWFEVRKEPEVRVLKAEGKVVNIRGTGSWENWCKIELKFGTGQVYLCSNALMERYNIRIGDSIKIYRSNYYGLICVNYQKKNRKGETNE